MTALTEPQAQALDIKIARTGGADLGGQIHRPDEYEVARLVVADHDRLCGTDRLALHCWHRASCREAARMLRSSS